MRRLPQSSSSFCKLQELAPFVITQGCPDAYTGLSLTSVLMIGKVYEREKDEGQDRSISLRKIVHAFIVDACGGVCYPKNGYKQAFHSRQYGEAQT